jgi:hypothetical protein
MPRRILIIQICLCDEIYYLHEVDNIICKYIRIFNNLYGNFVDGESSLSVLILTIQNERCFGTFWGKNYGDGILFD